MADRTDLELFGDQARETAKIMQKIAEEDGRG